MDFSGFYDTNDDINRLYKIKERYSKLYIKYQDRNDILYKQYYFENKKDTFDDKKYELFIQNFKQIVDNHNNSINAISICNSISTTFDCESKIIHKHTNKLIELIEKEKAIYMKQNLNEYDYFYCDTLHYEYDTDYHIFKNTLTMYINTLYVSYFLNNTFHENW